MVDAPSDASPPPGSPVFEQPREPTEDDVDALGHVNNVAWLRWAVELAGAHAEAAGYGEAALARRGYAWVVRHHDLTYHRPAGPGARVVGRTWVEFVHGARCARRVRFEGADGVLLMEARTEWAFVSLATGRPRRIPAALAAAFLPPGGGGGEA